MFELLQLYEQHTISDNSSDGAIQGIENSKEIDVWSRHCVAGGISAAISRTVLAPLDCIRMNMQVSFTCIEPQYKINHVIILLNIIYNIII